MLGTGPPWAVPLQAWEPGWPRWIAHRDEIRAIASRHRALSVSVFGSVARGDDGPDSDIDFLVEFAPGASLLDLMRIQDDLEALLGGHIDVVSAGGLKARDEHIRREAVLV